MPTSVPDVFISPWILPRTKKVSTGHFFTPVCGLVPSFRIHPHPLPIRKPDHDVAGFSYWQRMRDSNPRKRSQSPVCYRYTNPLYAEHYSLYPLFWKSQEKFSNIPQKFAVKPPGWFPPGQQGVQPQGPRRYPDSCRRSGCRCEGYSPSPWRWEPPRCRCNCGPGQACQDHPH